MNVRYRFWCEILVAVASGLLGILTLFVPDWIELLTGADPDGGDGSLEFIVVLSLLLICVAGGALAGREWRRTSVSRA